MTEAAVRAGYTPRQERVRTKGGLTARGLGLLVAAAALVAVAALSIAVGTKSIPLSTVWDALDGAVGEESRSGDLTIIQDLRIPRTLIGLAAGLAFEGRLRRGRWRGLLFLEASKHEGNVLLVRAFCTGYTGVSRLTTCVT